MKDIYIFEFEAAEQIQTANFFPLDKEYHIHFIERVENEIKTKFNGINAKLVRIVSVEEQIKDITPANCLPAINHLFDVIEDLKRRIHSLEERVEH